MKRICMILMAILSLVFINNVYAVNYGTVQDNNNGTIGQILVNTGVDSGSTDIGTWTDTSFLKGVKGDTGATGAQGAQGVKGDTGATGAQGAQGVKGDTGATGAQGAQGVKGDTGATGAQGIQGVAGNDGIDGINGKDGLAGLNGSDGFNGLNGIDGKDGMNGVDGEKGDKGDTGENGKDVDPQTVADLQNTDTSLLNSITNTNERVDNLNNRIGKLEKIQFKLQLGVRIIDTKRVTVVPYVSENFTRGCVDEAGIRVTFKLGKSYEEKLIEKNEAKQRELQEQIYTMKADFAVYKAEHK